jgi:hypothetical protein
MSSPLVRLTLWLFLAFSAQPAWGSWQYTNGQTDAQGGFTYQATVTKTATNTFNGTAVLTAFSGSSSSIPSNVSIQITVNTTNSQGQPIQYNEWVNCTVQGFQSFTLNSDASWNGNVNVIGEFNLNGNDLSVGGDVIHQAGGINFGTLPQGSSDPDILFEIGGDYLQARDEDGNGSYETYCAGYLTMNDPADRMVVGGDVQFWTYANGYGGSTFSGGVLEIKGDFLAKADAGPDYSFRSSFPATGTHRTLLSGTGNQTVTFESPRGGNFNILEVTNPSGVSDSSTLFVTSGGTLQLNFPGTDIIGSLYLGGTPQPNGLYDSTNSGGLITGTGKLQIGPFASYSAWMDANAHGQSTDQDHDHDGVPNGIEYFMGKTGNDFTANPGITPDGNVTWPKSPAFNGSYAVQTSVNLKDWIEVTEDAAQVTKNPDSVIWRRPDGQEMQFVRLLVVPN